MRVLVIDDDPFMVQLASLVLESRGYEVSVADSGAAGLQKLAEPPPDLVLLDLGLPDIPGLEVLRRLKAVGSWAATRVLILTASDATEDLVKAKGDGATGYLCKPILPDTLGRMIDELMRQPGLVWLDDFTRARKPE